jgi:hypothetical protein
MKTFSCLKDAEEAVSKVNGSIEFESTMKVEVAKEPGRRVKCWNCGDTGHK